MFIGWNSAAAKKTGSIFAVQKYKGIALAGILPRQNGGDFDWLEFCRGKIGENLIGWNLPRQNRDTFIGWNSAAAK